MIEVWPKITTVVDGRCQHGTMWVRIVYHGDTGPATGYHRCVLTSDHDEDHMTQQDIDREFREMERKARQIDPVECPQCSGTGESEHWTNCPLCDASGEVERPVARSWLVADLQRATDAFTKFEHNSP